MQNNSVVDEYASTTLRLPADLWERVKAQAEREDMSANAFIVMVIRMRLEGDPLGELRGQVDDLQRRVKRLERKH